MESSHRLEKARRRYLASYPLAHADLAGLGLTEVPSWLFDRDLITLTLERNALSGLPPELGLLGRLELLDVRDNPLEQVPEVVRELVGLEELYLDGTRIRELPGWLRELPRLRYVQWGEGSWRRP
ncbi:MAG: hypothetical protein R3F61_29525 [Myxococcota bacterium]